MANINTNKIAKTLFIAASLGSLFFVPWLLVKAWLLPLPTTVQQQVDEAIEHGFDGVVVYIRQGQKPAEYFTAGWHDRDAKIVANPQALFKLASIKKLYDAVAVTKLVSDGRLALDKTVADYLPQLIGQIEYADKITLRMMLQHRSGMANFTDTKDFWSNPTSTFEQSVALIKDKSANFEPGEDYQYCNTNYLLINRIMDDVLGFDNFQFVQQRILQPLDLDNTFASLKDVNIEDVMNGYHVGYPFSLRSDEHGMLATAEDVGRFLTALNDGSVFADGEQEIYSSLYQYEHAGWVPGYQSFANYYKDLDVTIVQFYSTTDADLYYWNLSEIINSRIVEILRQ